MHPRTEHLEGEAEPDQFLPSQHGQHTLPDIATGPYCEASSPPAEGFAAAPPFTVAHVGGEYTEDNLLSEGKQSELASERVREI